MHAQEDTIADLANNLFDKRQRLIQASQPHHAFDDRSTQALEAEYQAAHAEYQEAQTAFARALKMGKRAA